MVHGIRPVGIGTEMLMGNENKMEMGMHVMGMGSALSQLLLFPIVILSM